MKRFYPLLIGSLLVIQGCGSVASIDSSTTVPVLIEEQAMPPVELDVNSVLPSGARVLQFLEMDLDGDEQLEYALYYELEDVLIQGVQDTVQYLHVYRFENNAWVTIKEDERHEKMGPGQLGGFDQVTVVRFDAAPLDYLLVSKGSAFNGSEGYYLFGEVSEGVFDDLPIPKAYLHPELYLTEEGDDYLSLERVKAKEDGLVETYGVACEGRNAGSHFGDSATTGFCRYIDVSQPFSENGFGEPAIVGIRLNPPPPVVIDTREKAEVLAAEVFPEDEWRAVWKWLQLDNGNVWLLTTQQTFKGDISNLNPCLALNNCPAESWIVDPVANKRYLISSQNGYMARIDVTATPQDDGYLRIDWDILAGNVTTTNLDRTEYVSQVDGSLKP